MPTLNISSNPQGFIVYLDGELKTCNWSGTVDSGEHTIEVQQIKQTISATEYVCYRMQFYNGLNYDTSHRTETFNLTDNTSIYIHISNVKTPRNLRLGLFTSIGHVTNSWAYNSDVNAFLADCESMGVKEISVDVAGDVKNHSHITTMTQILSWCENKSCKLYIHAHIYWADADFDTTVNTYLTDIGASGKTQLIMFIDQTEFPVSGKYNANYADNQSMYDDIKTVCDNFGIKLGFWWNKQHIYFGSDDADGESWLASRDHTLLKHAQPAVNGYGDYDLELWVLKTNDSATASYDLIKGTYGVWVANSYIVGDDISHYAYTIMTTNNFDRVLMSPNDRNWCDNHPDENPLSNDHIAAYQTLYANYPEWFGEFPYEEEGQQLFTLINMMEY